MKIPGEVVNGLVIGEMLQSCRIFYEGREQHNFFCKNDSGAKEIVKEWMIEYKKELGKMLFNKLYQDQSKWELRIY